MTTTVIGVLGAGTMGAGIAQVALEAGFEVILFDVAAPVLTGAAAAIARGLDKRVSKGQLTPERRLALGERLTTTSRLDALAAAGLVIEAVPEDLALKRSLFAQLDAACPPETVLATNTSSLSVSAVAGACARPDRVVGLHFFNPAPLMTLVEVVAGERSAPAAVEGAWQLVEAFGKTPVRALDTPGFIVNRVARPFYGEALRLVGDHGASSAQVDRALVAAGFKMGPFALMDMIGLDVNLAVTESVWRAFYEEPRFRPHPLQRRMVDAGRLGRKAGGGFYAAGETADAPDDRGAMPVTLTAPGHGRYALVGSAPLTAAWAQALAAMGHGVDLLGDGELPAELAGVAGAFELGEALPEHRHERRAQLAAALPADAWLASDDLAVTALEIQARTGRLAWRLSTWPAGVPQAGALELALPEDVGDEDAGRVSRFVRSLGREAVVVPDLPGLVGPRTLAMLVNEAAFAVEAGVATPAAIDTAMRLGTGYPLGPLAWGDAIGPVCVVALLVALREAFGERYRPAPWLVARARAGLSLAG